MKFVFLTLALVSGTVQAQVEVEVTPTFKELNETILTPKCLRCHSDARSMAGINLEGYKNVMQYVIAGAPQESLLLEVVGEDAITRMPLGKPLADQEIEYIRAWIQAGAPQ